MKITRQQQKLHDRANELIFSIAPGKHGREFLDCPQCHGHEEGCELFGCNDGRMAAADFIFHHWLPAAEHSIGKGAIFFTPPDFAVSVCQAMDCSGRLVEPTAGIGVIAYRMQRMAEWHTSTKMLQVTCIEQQPKFVEIGKRLVPEAEWHCGDAFDILPKLPKFFAGFGNPPFGNVPTVKGIAHFAVAELLIKHAEYGGVLVVPKNATNREGDHEESVDRTGCLARTQPDDRYLQWEKRNPGWALTPTCWPGPVKFFGANCPTHIAELSYCSTRAERLTGEPRSNKPTTPKQTEQPKPVVSLGNSNRVFDKPKRPVLLEQPTLL